MLESENFNRISAAVAEFHFTPLVIFLYKLNAGKYFQKNNFVNNILQ
jgi:hypothetical protein